MPPQNGHVVYLSFTWGDHRIHMAKMYLTNLPVGRAFVDHTLGSVSATGAMGDNQLLGVGDFGFVRNPHLNSNAREGGRGADIAAQAFQRACPHMLDEQLGPGRDYHVSH